MLTLIISRTLKDDMDSNRKHWENFYSKGSAPVDPSPFAIWMSDLYKGRDKQMSILDCGCGNGRDTVHFALQGIFSVGIDVCPEAISAARYLALQNRTCRAAFEEMAMSEIDTLMGSCHVYSRFSLHAVDEATERSFIWKASKLIGKDGLLAIEARTTKDEQFHSKADHKRRFINPTSLKKMISDSGLNIVHFEESQGLAVYKDQDPWVLRVVACQA